MNPKLDSLTFTFPSHQSLSVLLKAIPCLYNPIFSNPRFQFNYRRELRHTVRKAREKMSDWGPVFVAVVLFILLTPGLLVQIPGRQRLVEFGNFQTSGASILVHSILYFALICIFLLAIGVHVYVGS